MKRFLLLPAVAFALVACSDDSTDPTTSAAAPGSVAAASVHLKGGKTTEPSLFDLGLALNEQADVSGLGGGDIFVGLSALALGSATCTNPGSGEHQPAGQNPAPVAVSGGVAVPASEIKNGNLHFTVTTVEPPHNPRAATKQECPGVNWTYELTDLAFYEATVTIQQPQNFADPTANIVFTLTCTISPRTANGQVPELDVSC